MAETLWGTTGVRQGDYVHVALMSRIIATSARPVSGRWNIALNGQRQSRRLAVLSATRIIWMHLKPSPSRPCRSCRVAEATPSQLRWRPLRGLRLPSVSERMVESATMVQVLTGETSVTRSADAAWSRMNRNSRHPRKYAPERSGGGETVYTTPLRNPLLVNGPFATTHARSRVAGDARGVW